MYSQINNTTTYSSLDGNSKGGSEGRWIGYRHNNTATVLMFYGGTLYFSNVRNVGTSNIGVGYVYQII